MQDLTVVINGGGMVGAASALAFAKAGACVKLFESNPPSLDNQNNNWDLRISSVNAANWQWLLSLGIHGVIDPGKVKDYQRLTVTTQSGRSLTFDASEVGLTSLGVMVENNALQSSLWQCLRDYDNVDFVTEQRIDSLDSQQKTVRLTNNELIPFDLLLGCDGANSIIAKLSSIGYRGWDYDQRCLLANVELEQPIEPETWEVFRPQGPYALLPLSDTKACLIDYDERASIRALQHDESSLQKHLYTVFEPRVGKFRVIKAASFPLQRKHALNYTSNGCIALLGDSAHSIHPMAGQGVNLGFADIQCLVSELSNKPVFQALNAYEKQRKFENAKMMRLMDALQISWRSAHPLARFIADVSLNAAKAPLLKNFLIKQAIGD